MHSTTLATLAWSAEHQAVCQGKPIELSLIEQRHLRSNQLLLALQLSLTPAPAATVVRNFYPGARSSLLEEEKTRHPRILIGAWRHLIWPIADPPCVAEPACFAAAGESAGDEAAQQAGRQGIVLYGASALRNLARLTAALSCPHTAHLNPEQRVRTFCHGFIPMYWFEAGRWSAVTSRRVEPLHLKTGD